MGSLKIIISDVPDNVKLQVVSNWYSHNPHIVTSSSSDPAGEAPGQGDFVWEGAETRHGQSYNWGQSTPVRGTRTEVGTSQSLINSGCNFQVISVLKGDQLNYLTGPEVTECHLLLSFSLFRHSSHYVPELFCHISNCDINVWRLLNYFKWKEIILSQFLLSVSYQNISSFNAFFCSSLSKCSMF